MYAATSHDHQNCQYSGDSSNLDEFFASINETTSPDSDVTDIPDYNSVTNSPPHAPILHIINEELKENKSIEVAPISISFADNTIDSNDNKESVYSINISDTQVDQYEQEAKSVEKKEKQTNALIEMHRGTSVVKSY